MTSKTPLPQILPAAFVHVLTASGVIPGLLALAAASRREYEAAFAWLGLALFIDGIDGPLARRFRVKEVLPRFSGERLDLVVDYLTYVVVPAVMLYQSQLMPAGWGMPVAALAAVTSLYHFADRDSKSGDNFFVGFPATWNFVVFYLLAVPCPPAVALAIVVALSLLTFAPLKWQHPVRVTVLRPVTFVVMALWTVSAAAALAAGLPASPLHQAVLLLCGTYMLGLSAVRSAGLLAAGDRGGRQ